MTSAACRHSATRPRASCTGAPLLLKPSLASEQLRAALRTLQVADLTLHASLLRHELTHGELVWALGGAAATLTALRGLPLEELHDSRPVGLAAFSRLQALILRRQPGESGSLRATMLPQSLTSLRLEAADPWAAKQHLPQLIGMGRLHHLQHMASVGHAACRLRYGHEEEERLAVIPHSLEVWALHPKPNLLRAVLQGVPCTKSDQCRFHLNGFSALGFDICNPHGLFCVTASDVGMAMP